MVNPRRIVQERLRRFREDKEQIHEAEFREARAALMIEESMKATVPKPKPPVVREEKPPEQKTVYVEKVVREAGKMVKARVLHAHKQPPAWLSSGKKRSKGGRQ